MRHLADREIGKRAYAVALSKGNSLCALAKSMGLDRKAFYHMKEGNPPSVFTLQAMALHGWDVHYILTGYRK